LLYFSYAKKLVREHSTDSNGEILASDLVDGQGDAEIEQRAKQELKRPNGQVVGRIRPRPDASGKVIAYEVDIR
jgi:hypothetical protein